MGLRGPRLAADGQRMATAGATQPGGRKGRRGRTGAGAVRCSRPMEVRLRFDGGAGDRRNSPTLRECRYCAIRTLYGHDIFEYVMSVISASTSEVAVRPKPQGGLGEGWARHGAADQLRYHGRVTARDSSWNGKGKAWMRRLTAWADVRVLTSLQESIHPTQQLHEVRASAP